MLDRRLSATREFVRAVNAMEPGYALEPYDKTDGVSFRAFHGLRRRRDRAAAPEHAARAAVRESALPEL